MFKHIQFLLYIFIVYNIKNNLKNSKSELTEHYKLSM